MQLPVLVDRWGDRFQLVTHEKSDGADTSDEETDEASHAGATETALPTTTSDGAQTSDEETDEAGTAGTALPTTTASPTTATTTTPDAALPTATTSPSTTTTTNPTAGTAVS